MALECYDTEMLDRTFAGYILIDLVGFLRAKGFVTVRFPHTFQRTDIPEEGMVGFRLGYMYLRAVPVRVEFHGWPGLAGNDHLRPDVPEHAGDHERHSFRATSGLFFTIG